MLFSECLDDFNYTGEIKDIIFKREQDGRILEYDVYVKPYEKYLDLFSVKSCSYNEDGKLVVELIGF